MSETDLELLKRYACDHAEDAFSEIVRRHLNLAYSAALRLVRSPQLAEEVAQSAFLDLARNAARLKPDTIVTAWLYHVTRRTAIDVVRREARRRLREQIATEMTALNTGAHFGKCAQATSIDWTQIEPLLDDAMHALDDTDRAAVLLRYFENKSLREVGQALGTSEDAAQKRVSRAVERLGEFFAKRGVTVGASGLAVVISANAVQAAPVGLAVTVLAASLAETTIAATATATTTKAIVMTALEKVLITATIVATVGTGIWLTRGRASTPHSAQLSLSFAGFSTNAPQQVQARIRVSNSTPWRVAYRLGIVQVKSGGAWPPVRVTEGHMPMLFAGGVTNTLVELPETSGVWRVPAIACRTLSDAEFLTAKISRQITRLLGQLPPNRNIVMQTNFTPEIPMTSPAQAEPAVAAQMCRANLRRIDAAAAVYALENRQPRGAEVPWELLLRYLGTNQLPGCPANGTYTLGRVGEHPSCSIEGHTY